MVSYSEADPDTPTSACNSRKRRISSLHGQNIESPIYASLTELKQWQ